MKHGRRSLNDRIQLPFRFDPVRLQADLQQLESRYEEWIDHFVQQNYTGSWSVIPLRGPKGAAHPVMMIYSNPTVDAYEDTPFLKECPYFSEVLAGFQCPLLAARLMKLTTGSRIREHRDHDLDIESGTVRIHIPVKTNEQVKFYLNNRLVRMKAGECWYLRLSDPHRVINEGPDRVHLVIDMKVNDWLRQILQTAAGDHGFNDTGLSKVSK